MKTRPSLIAFWPTLFLVCAALASADGVQECQLKCPKMDQAAFNSCRTQECKTALMSPSLGCRKACVVQESQKCMVEVKAARKACGDDEVCQTALMERVEACNRLAQRAVMGRP